MVVFVIARDIKGAIGAFKVFYMGFIRLMIKCKLMLVAVQDFGGLQLGSLPQVRSLY